MSDAGEKGSGAKGRMTDAELAALQVRLGQDLQARFGASMEAFKKYLPDVYESFRNYRPRKALQFFCGENGEPNLMFPDEGGRVFYDTDEPAERTGREIAQLLERERMEGDEPAEAYDPYGQITLRYSNEILRKAKAIIASESKQAYSPAELGSVPNFIILGIGLGYPLQEALSRIEIANLIAVEPDPDLFYASIYACDWAGILKFLAQSGVGFKLIVGKRGDDLAAILKDFYSKHGEFLSIFKVTYVHYSSPDIEGCAQYVARQSGALHESMGFFDDHLFGTSHGFQCMIMGKHFVRRDAELPKEFRRWPLFVVGNGPSLDHDIPFLRRNQDKAVIIACGTALDTLYHAGVKPDFYAATERTPEISETIDAIPDQEFKDSLTLIAGDVIHPKTAARFKRTAIFGKAEEPFFWFCAAHHDRIPLLRPIDAMNPMVGNLGVASIFGFGFTEAYLFGLDCGRRISDDAAMHSMYSTIYGEAGVSDAGGNYSVSGKGANAVPGNFGGTVDSNQIFRLSIMMMEEAIKRHMFFRNDRFVIRNCSDGARIAGTIPARSDDLAFSSRPNLRKQDLLDYVQEELTFSPKLSRGEAGSFINAPLFSALADRVAELLRRKPQSRMAAVSRMMEATEYISALSGRLDTAAYGSFMSGSAQIMFCSMLLALFHVKDDRSSVDAVWDSLVRSCLSLIEDSKKLFACLPDYVLGEHYRFMDGKVGWPHEGSEPPKAPPYPHLFRTEFSDPVKKFQKRYE
ncbi:MAG: 6-hydroxymethylpterin diphosphokinase MptE-like protein [Succinivibrio sp.]